MQAAAAYLFLVALLGAILVTPGVIRLGRRWGVLDVPGPRKIHRIAMPLVGGWVLFLVLSVVLWGHLLVAIALQSAGLFGDPSSPLGVLLARAPAIALTIAPLYFSSAAVFFLGVIDDVRGLSVRSRLLVQGAVACGLVASGVHPGLPFLPSWLQFAIGVVWVVGITNSFNLLDGLDGLSTGVALMGTLCVLALAALNGQTGMIPGLAVLAGLQLGFLQSNWRPAKVFLGSSGSLLLGNIMAVITSQISIAAPGGKHPVGSALAPLLILAVPVYDTVSVMVIRLSLGRSVFAGDRNHLHHRLLRAGLGHEGAVILICGAALGTGSIAVSGMAPGASRVMTPLLIAAVVVLLAFAESAALHARRRGAPEAAGAAPRPVLATSHSESGAGNARMPGLARASVEQGNTARNHMSL